MALVGKPQILRLMNKDILESYIRSHGPVSKPKLSRLTGLSLVTVGKTVDELVAEGRVLPEGTDESTVGRTAQLFVINRQQFCFLALYYNDGQYECTLADAMGDVFHKELFAVADDTIVEDTMRCIEVMRNLAAPVPLASIGLGMPGVVSEGILTNIPSLPMLEGLDLASVLEEHFNCPVYIENDINLAAWGLYVNEFEGETEHLAYLYLDKGVGCGLVLNGRIFKGASDFAGEIGSLWPDGEPSKVSNALEQEFIAARQGLTASDSAGQPDQKRHFLEMIALLVNNITCILNPGLIVIKCKLLSPDDLDLISGLLSIEPQHRPKLVLIGDIHQQCLRGVLNLCMQNALLSGMAAVPGLQKRGYA